MSENSRRHPCVVNLSELPAKSNAHGERFAASTRWLTPTVGASGIGCSWYEVPPGKTAFPLHYHCANEEAAFILEGEGTLRLGEERIAVRAGDYLAFPTGPEHAHQLLNTGATPLRYLAFSTLHLAEVVGYPDSGKIAAAARPAPGSPFTLRAIFKQGTEVDYYDGE
jgi:uncharacterized cupin superfamily protein